LIKSIPDSASRTSRFARADIERLIARSQAHAGVLARAETAMRWGEPIISTQITEITPEGPRYRGRSAIDLARAGTSFEAVANFLWTGALDDEDLRFSAHDPGIDADRVVASLDVELPPSDVQNPRRVFIAGQKRGVFGVIKRELRRRSAIEPVIGHLKSEGHLGRCYLKGRAGDAANVILSAVGYNFRRILAWLRALCCLILTALIAAISDRPPLQSAS
jgi:hypothetical protein